MKCLSTQESQHKWLSFHFHYSGDFTPLLLDHIAPALVLSGRKSGLDRLFFIRMDEGGRHLRLRVRSCNAASSERVRSSVMSVASAFESTLLAEERLRCEEDTYDRNAMYFGPSCLSVYAELLNEATSLLALRVLGDPRRSGRRNVVTLSLLGGLYKGLAKNAPDLERLLAEAVSFAQTALQRYGFQAPEVLNLDSSSAERVLAGVTAVLQRRCTDRGLARVLRLLQRVRRLDGGQRVAVHAIHLLLNKLGHSLGQEYAFLRVLELLPGLRQEAA